jgi:hypothetical protein
MISGEENERAQVLSEWALQDLSEETFQVLLQ